MKAAVAGGAVIPFSIPMYGSWYRSPETRRTGRINMRIGNEPVITGHAMCIIGYQDDSSTPGGGYFIVRNSWGMVDWGAECPYGVGNGTIPYQYIASEGWEACNIAVPTSGEADPLPQVGGDSEAAPRSASRRAADTTSSSGEARPASCSAFVAASFI